MRSKALALISVFRGRAAQKIRLGTLVLVLATAQPIGFQAYAALPISTATDSTLLKAPVYAPRLQLEDAFKMADLIVAGEMDTDSSWAINVEEVLWSRVDESRTSVPLAGLEPPIPGLRGVWLLVENPLGYIVVNPNKIDITRHNYEALRQQYRLPEAGEPIKTRSELLPHSACTPHGLCEHFYGDPGRPILHGSRSSLRPDGLVLQIFEQGEKTLELMMSSPSGLYRIERNMQSNGFELRVNSAGKKAFTHYRNGLKEGVSREYVFGDHPDRMSKEVHYHRGLYHGLCRRWTLKDELPFESNYEMGLALPVMRYHGATSSEAQYCEHTRFRDRRPRRWVQASSALVASVSKIGMSAVEVSEILCLDFSLVEGISFAGHGILVFEDGKVSGFKRFVKHAY